MTEPVSSPDTGTETQGTNFEGAEVDTSSLETAVASSIAAMERIMITSIGYNTETTAITTLLGQNANRAAKQTPQG